MPENIYDLTVAYRIYPKVSKAPPIYSDNKYKLSELCLRSFKESLGNLKVKALILLDDCPAEYQALFKKYFSQSDLELINLGGVGNYATFNLQIDLLLKQNYSEIIYFAEDDYFYFPKQFAEMIELLKNNNDIDFVTPFEHPDYYSSDLHKHEKEDKLYSRRHWIRVNSTCLTFLTKKETLRKTKWVFKTYKYKNNDSSLWLSLTKYRVFNPILPIKYLFQREWFLFEIISFAWLFCWWQILLGKRWKLWAPKPTIATHMNSELMAPNINWKQMFAVKING